MTSVKVDKFGDVMFAEMYARYATDSLSEFKIWCVKSVHQNSVSSNLKKQEFSQSLNACSNKDRVVQKMTNYFLAGEGNRVFKTGQKVA